MLERLMEKEAFLGALRTLGQGASTLGRSGYHALRTGLQDAALARTGGAGWRQSMGRGTSAARQVFSQQGGAGIVQRNPGKFLAGGLAGAGAMGYAAAPSYSPYSEYQGRLPRRELYVKESSEMPNIDSFLEPKTAHTLKTAGLHRVMAAMEKVANGRDVGPELTLPIGVQLLGERFFTKRAEYRQIQNGLRALRALKGE